MSRSVKIAVLILCMLIMVSPGYVMAAGTTALSVSTNTPTQGDTFTVTATATASGNMTVKYNSNVLSVVGCDVPGFTQSSGEVNFTGTRGTITFKANAPGGSPISVSSNNASASSVVITVGASSTAATVDFELNGVKYTVSEKFSSEEIPEGFSQTTFLINDKNLKGVTNGIMNLIYLKPIDNVSGPGKFFIYDDVTHGVSDYFFLGKPDYYVIPSEPAELINDSLRKGQITIDSQTVDVYTLQGIDDFVYVYGTCSDTTVGWFEYDVYAGTVQRINEAIFDTVTTKGEGASVVDTVKSVNIRYIIAALIFIAIVIIAIVINIILKKRDDKADLIDGSQDYVKGDAKSATPTIEDIYIQSDEDDQEKKDKKDKKDKKINKKKEDKKSEDERRDTPTLDDIEASSGDEDTGVFAKRKTKKEKDEEEYMKEVYDEYDDFDIDGIVATGDTTGEAKEDVATNIFGDEELDLSKEAGKNAKKNRKAKGPGSDIIDFNNL